jgi:HSP20 family protein
MEVIGMIRSPLFGELLNLSNTLDQLTGYRSGGSQVDRRNGAAAAVPMPLDVYATGDQAVLIAAVPGMQPEDLDLSVHQNTVTLSGTVRSAADAEETKDATWYVSELGSGTYQRSVTLPFPIDVEHAEATFEHGLVRVTLPKAESAKPRKIAISGSATRKEAITASSDTQRLVSHVLRWTGRILLVHFFGIRHTEHRPWNPAGEANARLREAAKKHHPYGDFAVGSCGTPTPDEHHARNHGAYTAKATGADLRIARAASLREDAGVVSVGFSD